MDSRGCARGGLDADDGGCRPTPLGHAVVGASEGQRWAANESLFDVNEPPNRSLPKLLRLLTCQRNETRKRLLHRFSAPDTPRKTGHWSLRLLAAGGNPT
jgi:hypothetical protein